MAFVPLGTPLLAGPGAIVATMLFVQRVDSRARRAWRSRWPSVAVAVAAWLAMRFSGVIHRVLTDNGVELLTRIAGLLLSAIAVQLVDAVRAGFRRPGRVAVRAHAARGLESARHGSADASEARASGERLDHR